MGLFDDVLNEGSPAAEGGLFDDVIGSTTPKKQNKGLVADIGTDLKRGVQNIPSAITGLADIPVAAVTGSPLISAAAEGLGKMTGFQPGQWAKEAEQEYSEGRKQARQNIDAAWKDGTAGDIASAYLQNPSQIVGSIAESLPSMLVGGLAGRAALGIGGRAVSAGAGGVGPVLPGAIARTVGEKLAPAVGAGLGEGAVMAGQAMDNLTEQGVDPRTAAGYAAGTGLVGAALGAGGGKVAQMLGVVDPETAIAGGAARAIREGANATKWQAAKETGKNIIGGGISEGIFEELPQSVMEQAFSNLAQDKPIGEGVARAGVEGSLAGFGMGAGFNAIPAKQQGPLSRTVDAGRQSGAIQDQPTLALGYNANVRTDGAPLYTYPDGSTLTQAEYEQRQAAEEKQRLDGMIQDNAPTVTPLSELSTLALQQAGETTGDLTANQMPASDWEILRQNGLVQTGIDADGFEYEFVPAYAFGEERERRFQEEKANRPKVTDDEVNKGIERRAQIYDRLAKEQDDLGELGDQERAAELRQKAADIRAGKRNGQSTNESSPKPDGLAERMMQSRTDEQLTSLSGDGVRPALRQAAIAEMQRRMTMPAQPTTVEPQKQEATPLTLPERVRAAKSSQIPTQAPQANDAQARVESSAAQEAEGVASEANTQAPAQAEQTSVPVQSIDTQSAPVQQAANVPNSSTVRTVKKAGPHNRDDLVGAILRVTGNKGLSAGMAQTITGDKAGSGNAKLRGLFTNDGIADLDDTAELLRTEEGYDVRDGNHLAELVREQAAGNAVYSMERTEREAAENAEKEYKASVNQKAEELGLKKVGGKRTLAMVEADIAAKEKEISEQEAREERASIQASEIAEDIYQEGSELTEADLMQWLGDRIEYSQDEINEANSRASERESRRVEKNAGDDSQEQAQGSSPEGAGTGATEAGARSTESLTEPTDDLISRAKALGMKTVGVSAEKLTKQVEEAESFNLIKQTNDQAAAENESSVEQKIRKEFESSPISIGVSKPITVTHNGVTQRFMARQDRVVSNGRSKATIHLIRIKQGRMVSGSELQWIAEGYKLTGTDSLVEEGLPKVVSEEDANQFNANFERQSSTFDLTGQTNVQAAAEYKRQQEEANKKDEEPASPTVKADQVDMWNTQGSLIDNNRDSEQKPSNSETTPALTAADSVISQAESIEDFGEKLEGARKDRTPSLSKELSDDDIATQPLSKIWPAAEIDAIENTFAAAVAFSARNEIPAKPRKSYLVARWVEKVKVLRSLAAKIVNIGEDKARDIWNKVISSSDFKAKVVLLEAIDRDQWKRIGAVSEHPTAYRFNNDGSKETVPFVNVEIDGKRQMFEGAKSVADVVEKVNGLLGVEQQAKKMQFEVRGYGDRYFINKKGDKEHRRLKEFTNTKDAFAFIKNNYDDLVAAWDGVKDRDNVTKADVRNAENRPRTGSDWRNGKDVTAEQFQDAFGFRGGQFGKWVTQGNSAKERQWMLNQSYDALMDLSSIVGIPPKAISLNGSLGLAFGARGSGNAAAHFEPDTLVINLTKTKGAGSLAHEWFHALDNYFSRQRGGEVKIKAGLNAQQAYRTQNFITYRPEPMMVHKTRQSTPITRAKLMEYHTKNPSSEYYNPENWHVDPKHPAGVRPEVERAFAELVEALDASPMKSRAAMNDKAADGYWSRIIERGARSFENFVIFKMMENGYSNDYLANVREVQDFPRAKERYPYLLPEEVAPIAEAFDNLFSTIKTKETDNGIAMYSKSQGSVSAPMQQSQAEQRIKSLLGNKVGRLLIESGIITFTNKGNAYQGATYTNGTIALNLDALSADNFDGVLLHEGFHSTIKQLVGEETYAKLMKQLENMLAMGRGAQWVKDANAAVPKKTAPENVTEEIAAYAIEQHKNGGKIPSVLQRWVQSFLSAIRTAIIQRMTNGKLKSWAVANVTAQDLANLALAGLKAKAAGQVQAQGREAMAYSKNESSDTVRAMADKDTVAGKQAPTSSGDGSTGSDFVVRPPKRLYRGIVKGEQADGSDGLGTFMLGSGLYSSPSKSFAKKYGDVVELDVEASFPKNPLVLHARPGSSAPDVFRDWLFKERGFKNMRDFNAQYNDPADYVKSLGYDGVFIGDEVVKYYSSPNEPSASAGSDDGIRYSKASQAIRSAVGAVTGAESKIVGASNRQYDQAQRQFFKNVGRDVERKNVIGRTLDYLRSDFWKKMAVGIVDQFRGLRDLGDNGQAYLLARLSKGTAGAFDALLNHGKLSLRDGVYDADTSGGFLQRLGVTLNGEIDDFLWWTAANRAEKLSKEDRENLFTPQDIAAGKSLATGTTEFDYTVQTGPLKGKVTRNRAVIYADANRVFNEFQKNTLDMAEQSGLIDGSTRHLWESEFYVPFYRVSDEDGEFVGAKMGNALVRQQAFKKLKGGTDKLNADLLANTLMNWSHLIEASAKNRAAKASLEAAGKMGAAQRVAATMGEYAKSNGSMLPPGTKGAVWYMDGGKKIEYLVSDPFVMTAITSLEYAGMRNGIMDVLTKFKHYLTIGVTASPAFKVRNLIRDSIQAIGTSDLSYNPIKNVTEGFKQTKRDSQEYVSALASGGLIRFGTMLEGSESSRVRQLIKAGVKDSTILNTEDKWQAFYDQYLDPAISAYNELGNRSEEINRAALYNQLIKQGKSHAEAALLARDLMDFSMQGSFNTIRFLTQTVPFLNARLVGMYKLGRAAKENPKKMAIVTGVVALAGMSLLLAYGDDDDWKKREDWDLNNFFWFKFGDVAFRIPRPFEIGAVASLAERSLQYMIDDEMTGERFRKVVGHLLMDNLSMNPTPQAIKPIVDLYANRDSFTGRPIETMGMDKLDPTERYTSNTSMVARGASKALMGAASPVQIDHLARSYFGWIGSFVVGGADMAARAMNDEPTKPTLDYFKFSTQGIVSEANSPSSRYVTNIYDQAKELEQAYGTWRRMIKEGKIEDAQEYAADNRDKLNRYKSVESVKKIEAKFTERIRQIERSNIDPDEKKSQIANVNRMKDFAARRLTPGYSE